MDYVTGAVAIVGLRTFGPATADVVKTFLNRVLAPVGDASGKALAHPIEEWHRRRVERGNKLVVDAATMLAEVNIEPSRVEDKILLPLLESGSLEEDSELQKRWAALLANAATPSMEIPILPAYAELLRQLIPMHARILERLYSSRIDGEDGTQIWPAAHGMAVRGALGLTGGQYSLIVSDLERLQLITSASRTLEFPESGTSLSEVVAVLERHMNRREPYEALGITALGVSFMTACTPPITAGSGTTDA
jgi:hypothetical protein